MTNKKQTAVEFLIEQIEGLNINDDTVWAEVTKQAKEMEKQQIIDAYCEGRMSVIEKKIILVEQYYNETYE